MSFGLYGTFPFTFGDTSNDALEVEHNALLDALEPAFDPTENTVHEVECFAHANVIAAVWEAGERLSNQAIPEKMLEALPDWEEILNLNPAPGTSDFARRAAVAARQRGLTNNALPDIEAVAAKVMGANYEAVVIVDPADVVSYWPGGTPGPPSYEWTSNEAVIAIRVNKTGLDDSAFLAKVGRLREQLDRLLPSWMRYNIGTGGAFIVGQSIVGQDLI